MQRHKGFESVEVVWHDREDIGPGPGPATVGGPPTVGITMPAADERPARAQEDDRG